MKKLLFFILAVSCFSVSTATAQVGVFFSTSSTNPTEGTVLSLNDGDLGSLFVWAENNDVSGLIIDGLSLDIFGAGPSSLTATSFDIVNGGRWILGTAPGTLGSSPGSLVDDSNAATFNVGPTNGIRNGIGPVLHGTLNFSAAGTGSNSLGFALGGNLISLEGSSPISTSFGTGTVNVTSAVPEPSSLFLAGSFAGCMLLRRRRS